jgi:hypothetical protein
MTRMSTGVVQEEKSPTDTIVSFITTAFFGSSADTGLEARAPATTPTDYPSISQPNGVLDSLLYALAEGCDTGDLRGQTVPALAVLNTCTAYEVRGLQPSYQRIQYVLRMFVWSGSPVDATTPPEEVAATSFPDRAAVCTDLCQHGLHLRTGRARLPP